MTRTATMIDSSGWVEVDLPLYGVRLRVPRGWETLPPVPSNGHELVRVTGHGTLQVILFKLRSHGLPVADIAERTRTSLEASGFTGFEPTEQPVADVEQGARLVFRYAGDDRPGRTSWEYFVVRGPAVFILGFSSAAPDEGLDLIEAVASTLTVGPAGGPAPSS